MGNKKATGFLCLRLVPCFAYVGAEDNRKGIPFVKIVSLLCKLIQFLMVALSVTVHKALILLVFLNHPYQSLAFSRLFGLLGITPTRSRNLFLKQLCLEIICSSSSKNFDYPYYQSYTMGAYQNLIIGDKLSQEVHSSYYRWLVCILAYPCQVFQTISGIFERIKHAHSILANLSANSATIVLAPTIRLCPAYAGQTHAQPWNRRAYTIRQKTVLPHPSNRMRTLC